MARPIPQSPWEATHQPPHLFAQYPAAARGAVFGSGVGARSPVDAYLSSPLRIAPIGTLRALLTQDEAQQQALSGLDPTAAAGLAVLGLGAVGLAIMFFGQAVAGYYVGKAVAPTKADEKAYGIGGAIATGFLGPIGAAGVSTVAIIKGDR